MFRVAVILSFTMILAAPCGAQDAGTRTDAATLPENIIRQIRRAPERMVEQTIRTLFQISPDGIVTQDAVDIWLQAELARTRASLLSQLLIFDLDGDLDIDAAEITRQQPHLDAAKRARLQTLLVQADTDTDGTLSQVELIAHVAIELDATDSRQARHGYVMAFDANRDGRVTAAEVAQVIDKIAQHEPTPAVSTPDSGPVGADACHFPPVPDGAETVLISGHAGMGLSTVAIDGQDEATTVATVTIASGDSPLYIVAYVGGSIIWQVDGATERVAKFVLAQQNHHAGVVGLAGETLEFSTVGRCLTAPLTQPDGGEALIQQSVLTKALARDRIDHLIAARRFDAITVPPVADAATDDSRNIGDVFRENGRQTIMTADGPVKLQINGSANRIERMLNDEQVKLWRSFPRGVVELDADAVTANGLIEDYRVLPRAAGMLQLVEAGALTPTSDGYYLVNRDIGRFPAGLHGSHAAHFILREGVPMPDGPGHSSVTLEETGECVIGPRCR